LYLQFLDLRESENLHFLFRSKTKFWYKNANFFAREEDRMTSADSNLFVDVEMTPIRMTLCLSTWTCSPPCGRHKWMAPDC